MATNFGASTNILSKISVAKRIVQNKWGSSVKAVSSMPWMKIYLAFIFLAIFLLVISFSFSFVADYVGNRDALGGICFSSECLVHFYSIFRVPIDLVIEGFTLIAFVAAIFGSIIALGNYHVSVKSSALAGHISHLKLFQDYVEGESIKAGIDHRNCVDIYLWYRNMFPDSSQGDVKISDYYKNLVKRLIHEVERSDSSLRAPNVVEKYTFTNGDHQRRLIEALASIGVSISRKEPKIFSELETSAFRLIDSVNLTFSKSIDEVLDMQLLEIRRSYL
jgi:hypothetical protein